MSSEWREIWRMEKPDVTISLKVNLKEGKGRLRINPDWRKHIEIDGEALNILAQNILSVFPTRKT